MKKGRNYLKNYLATFLALFAFWIIMSEQMTVKFITIGIVTSILVTFLTKYLLRLPEEGNPQEYYLALDFSYIKYIRFWFWLIKEIIVANIEIALIVLNPKLPINPQIISFKQKMKNPLAHLTLGNSITLTPGTITVEIVDGEYVIHAFSLAT